MLLNALLPLIRPLQVTSLNPFSVASSKSHLKLNYFTSKRFNLWSVLSIVLLLMLILHGIFDSDFYTGSEDSIEKTIFFIKMISVRLTHVTVLIESFVQRQNLIEIIDILSLIDLTLMKKLGVDVGHKALTKLILNCLIIGFTFFIFIESSVLAIFLNRSSIAIISYWLASLFSFSVICLRYLQIIIFIYILHLRLSVINLNLNKIDTETIDEFNSREKLVSIVEHLGLEEDNRGMLKMQNKKFKNFDEISVLRELFGKLWDVSKLINTCFGVSLLVCVGNDFGTVTLNGYWMYLSYKKSKNVAIISSIGLWCVPHVMSLMLIAGFCYSTVSKVGVKK